LLANVTVSPFGERADSDQIVGAVEGERIGSVEPFSGEYVGCDP
jgi:hypothetical protein